MTVLDSYAALALLKGEPAAADVRRLLHDGAPLDSVVALRAGLLRARHYHRRHRPVSLADCVAAEPARALDDAVATSDPHLLDTCRDEGISVVALADSGGNTWSP